MGLGDILPEGPIRSRISSSTGENFSDVTIRELEDEFGEQAVARGISYMASLAEAEENYKESATAERMKDGYGEAAKGLSGKEPDEPTTKVEEASEKWAEESRDSGIGLED